MFGRIVSNLPFSPALIGQLSLYARRLRGEEVMRRLGLLFTALAIIVQTFVLLNPPEAHAAASSANLVFEGASNKEDFLRAYDANIDRAGHKDIQQIFTYFGITRDDLRNAREGYFNSRDFNLSLWSVGRISYDAGTPYEKPHVLSGSNSTLYARKLLRFDQHPRTIDSGTNYKALIGQRADGSWFGVSLLTGNIAYTSIPQVSPNPEASCSNLFITKASSSKYRFTATAVARHGATIKSYTFTTATSKKAKPTEISIQSSDPQAWVEIELPEKGTYSSKVVVDTSLGKQTGGDCEQKFVVSDTPACTFNLTLAESHSDCKPCPGERSLWYKNEACIADFAIDKAVVNATQKLDDATRGIALPGDRIQYVLSVTNTGTNIGKYQLNNDLTDVLEYADLLDTDGGTIEKNIQNGGNDTRVVWQPLSLHPGKTASKVITVQVKSVLPSTPQNTINPESYNCVMSNSFSKSTHVKVECPTIKVIENTVAKLPSADIIDNLAFGGIVALITLYFYVRARLLQKEVQIIRKDFGSGTL